MKEELANISPISFDIKVVQISEETFDVIIAGEPAILDAFAGVYDNLMYVEKSKFGFPIVVAPDFSGLQYASIWKNYWEEALSDPANSCDSCPSIKEFFTIFLRQRSKYQIVN